MTADRFLPFLAVGGGAVLWGAWWIPLRALEARGLSADWATVATSLCGVLLLLPVAIAKRHRLRQSAPALLAMALFAGALVAITNATILTASHGTIERGTILIRNGKIAEVGPNVQVPAGARVIDGTGKYITPGIIDAHSHSAAEAINEGTQSSTAEVRMEDVLRQDGMELYRQLAGGTTTLNILHGSANTIGGQNAVVKLRFGLPVMHHRSHFISLPPTTAMRDLAGNTGATGHRAPDVPGACLLAE